MAYKTPYAIGSAVTSATPASLGVLAPNIGTLIKASTPSSQSVVPGSLANTPVLAHKLAYGGTETRNPFACLMAASRNRYFVTLTGNTYRSTRSITRSP